MANQHEQGLNQIERLMRDPISYFWPNHNLSKLEYWRMLDAINGKNYWQIAYRDKVARRTVRNTIWNGRGKLGRTTTQIRIMTMDEIRRIVNESLGLG